MSTPSASAAATTGLPVTFDIRLLFHSDWHVGTGEGRVGVLDALVHRDADGLPHVPAKTITGVWRDACETVARILDGQELLSGPGSGPWGTWVQWIFGSTREYNPDAGQEPIPAALGIGPATIPFAVSAALRGKPDLIAATVATHVGVALDAQSGTAVQDHLRLEERAAEGVELVSSVSGFRLDLDALPAPAEFLLRAGARLVDGIGGKRTRGAGRVSLLLPGALRPADDGPYADVQDARLAELALDPELIDDPGTPPSLDDAMPLLTNDPPSSSPRQRLRFTLLVRTPLVVADRLLGNTQTTRTTVPGTMLLQLVLKRIHGPGRLSRYDIVVHDAVPAVVEDGAAIPSVPAPATWYRSDKGRGPVLVNRMLSPDNASNRSKPVSGPYLVDGCPEVRPLPVRLRASTHATISDEHRRPVESAGGGLFSHIGIAPGTVLSFDVVLPADTRISLTPGDLLRLGRSRKDDFGQVEVIDRQTVPHPAPPPNPLARLHVWCLSDVLLRDERLAPDPTPSGLARELTTQLGIPLTVVTDEPATGTPTNLRTTAVGVSRRESFAVPWGRPRPSVIGLAAGSVVTLDFPPDSPPTPQALAAIERQGIGQRRTEGFGRIRINAPELLTEHLRLDTGHSVTAPDLHRPTAASAKLSESEQAWLNTVELSAWQTIIRRQIDSLLSDPEQLAELGPRPDAPTWSQLGILRSQMRSPSVGKTGAWFRRIEQSEEVQSEKWSQDALKALRRLLVEDLTAHGTLKRPTGRPSLWEMLDLHGDQPQLCARPGREPELRAELLPEARSHLVLALIERLRHGTKERR